MGLLDILLPREVAFFKLMNEQAETFYDACKAFRELVRHLDRLSDAEIRKQLTRIKRLEKKGDQIEREIVEKLNTTFLTPIDREDIHDIASKMDDALDYINDISQKIEIFKIRKAPKNVLKFADIIVEASGELKHLIATFEKKKDTKKTLINIHNLEEEADDLFHESIAELFENTDPIYILKFKDIYEHLEETVDSIDITANLIRGVTVKRG